MESFGFKCFSWSQMNVLGVEIDCSKFLAITFVIPNVTGISVLTDELVRNLACWFEKLKPMCPYCLL